VVVSAPLRGEGHLQLPDMFMGSTCEYAENAFAGEPRLKHIFWCI